ncbi:MAG: hypothetical protein RI554_03030 [Trueperaceae bacterium]|nr:hypothetical protein [Trueperaceae bacterium]
MPPTHPPSRRATRARPTRARPTTARAAGALRATLAVVLSAALAGPVAAQPATDAPTDPATDAVVLRYDRTREALDDALAATPGDPDAATTALERARTALGTLAIDADAPLLASADAVTGAATAAADAGNAADLAVHVAALRGAAGRLLYESGLAARVRGDAGAADARLRTVLRDVGLDADAVLPADDASVRTVRRAVEAALADDLAARLSAWPPAGGVADAYRVLAETYGASLLLHDAPDLPRDPTDAFLEAAEAWVGGDADRARARTRDLADAFTTLATAARTDAPPEGAAAPTDAASPAAPSEAVATSLARYGLPDDERARLAMHVRERGADSVDALADGVATALARAHGAWRAGDVEGGRTHLRTAAARYDRDLGPVVVAARPALDASLRAAFDRAARTPAPRPADAADLAYAVATLPDRLAGAPAAPLPAVRTTAQTTLAGTARPAVEVGLGVLALLAVVAPLAARGARGRGALAVGLAFWLAPVVLRGVAAGLAWLAPDVARDVAPWLAPFDPAHHDAGLIAYAVLALLGTVLVARGVAANGGRRGPVVRETRAS